MNKMKAKHVFIALVLGLNLILILGLDFSSGRETYTASPMQKALAAPIEVMRTNSLIDGLVAYYPFDGDANDASGNGNHGTVHGATLTVDRFDRVNHAYHFDGTNDYIVAPSSSSLALTSTATFAMWVNVDSDINYNVYGGPHLFSKGATYGDLYADYAVSLEQNDSIFELCDSANGVHGAALPVVPKAQWVHLAFVYQNGTVTMYQNGIQVTQPITIYSPMRVSTQPLYFAHRYLTIDAGAFKGSLDEIRIYNRALSQNEIRAMLSPYLQVTKWVLPIQCLQGRN